MLPIYLLSRAVAPAVCSNTACSQVFVGRPLLRRAIEDVSTARAMLLILPPELLLRVPAIVRLLHDITSNESTVRRRSSEDGITRTVDDAATPAPADDDEKAQSSAAEAADADPSAGPALAPVRAVGWRRGRGSGRVSDSGSTRRLVPSGAPG